MGSLRNPVGPLPSSIYWRRRVVIVSVVALLALLITWIVTMGGGSKNGADGGNGDGSPTPSTITPGPSGSGPAISQAPGGRDETGDGDSNGSSSGSGSGSGDTGGTSDGANGDDGSAGGGSEGGAGSGGGTGDTLPAGSTLPNCTTGAVKLSLRSLHNAYGLGQTPSLELTATNSSGGDCKVDLGPQGTVLTITQAGSDEDFWSSEDCPKTSGSLLYRVPAGSSVTYTVEWDRKASAPECGTPSAGSAAAGTYLVEAVAPGFAKVQTSFVLEKD